MAKILTVKVLFVKLQGKKKCNQLAAPEAEVSFKDLGLILFSGEDVGKLISTNKSSDVDRI